MKNKYICQHLLRIALLTMVSGIFMACSEEIDMTNRYTFTNETILSFLEKNLTIDENASVAPERSFSEYVTLLKQVPVSEFSQSSVAQLLTARGHYTVFAPNNKAIYDYLQELTSKGVITEASWNGFKSQADLDSIRKVIVYNSIIDCNEQEAYDVNSFPIKAKDPFPRANMNDRKMYWTYEGGETDPKNVTNIDVKYINGKAMMDLSNRDLEAVNGRIHEIHGVIAPSNDTMADLLKQWIAEGHGQFTVFAKLIVACGLADTLSKTRDEAWETIWKTEAAKDLGKHPSYGQFGHLPEHRKYGFTIFAETDQVWEDLFENTKTKDEITVDDVFNYLVTLQDKGNFPNAKTNKEYDKEDNILNQFVTYHILPEAISRDKLVIHYNEKGHDYKSTSKTIPVYDYYTTMGKRRLLKIYESAESDGIYLNRFPLLRNGRGEFSIAENDYLESGRFKPLKSAVVHTGNENEGIKIAINNSEASTDNDPFNGYIYPIDRLLVYSENVKEQLYSERIRIDCATMFPEMINNDWRRPMSEYARPARCTHDNACNKCVGFPAKPSYPYFADIQIEENTSFYYLSGYGHGWSNYQMDEFNIIGNYEFTMKLPPVPKLGTYELRFGVSAGSNNRSMCQVYWGDNKNYLPAAGIPMDLRIGFERTRFYGGSSQVSNFGYTAGSYINDKDLPQEDQDEIDKRLRSRDFMKGPEYFYYGTSANNLYVARNYEHVTRRIMVRKEMDPDKTYYIRFKNVLDNPNLEFYMDYLEFVSKDVYDNPEVPEDKW